MKSKWQPILKNNESWKSLNTSQETPWISKFWTLQIPQLIKTATLTVAGPVLTLPLTFSHETNRKKKPGFVYKIQMTNLIVKLSQEDANFWLFCEAEGL